MNFDLSPILVVLFIWFIVGSAVRNAAAKQKKASGAQKPGAGASARKTPEPAPAAATSARPEVQAPSAPRRAAEYTGSLGGSSLEGIDPCHDDPGAFPPGSLSAKTMEGIDPCHDDWEPAAAENPAPAESRSTGGLKLGWTGNEVVKGLVYSEILKRKA